jgi:hypothetical protein
VTANQRDPLCEEQRDCWLERRYALLLCRENSSLSPRRQLTKITHLTAENCLIFHVSIQISSSKTVVAMSDTENLEMCKAQSIRSNKYFDLA